MKPTLNLIFTIALATNVEAQNQANMTINQNAPVIQKREIIIKVRPEKVWEVLTKIENWDKWNYRIKKPKIDGRSEAGKKFTWKTKGSKIKSEIHTFIPYKTLGWKGKTFGAKAIHNWYLESTEQGTTVVVEESMEGRVIGLMKKKMNRILAEDMTYWLEQLKIEFEK